MAMQGAALGETALGGAMVAAIGPGWVLAADAVAFAVAGPAESAFGRSNALWGCATLVVLVTAAVLCVPDVRNLRRTTKHVVKAAGTDSGSDSADAERPVGGLG